MSRPSTHFEIRSSENFITPGFELDLIAVKHISELQSIVVSGKWSFTPNINGIFLINSKLFVSHDVQNLDEIVVHCILDENANSISRTYKVISSQRINPLIHFIKNDGGYSGADFIWDIWTYEDREVNAAIAFTNHSDFGISAHAKYSNIIIRKKTWGNHWNNEWSEQTISFTLDMRHDNYYVVYGIDKIFTSLVDIVHLINPRIIYAVMDDKDKITATLSHIPLTDTQFKLYINSELQQDVVSTWHNKQLILTNLPIDVEPHNFLEIRADSTFPPSKVIMRNYLDNFYYSANDMGVTFTDTTINLRLWAPTAKKVEVLLYNKWQELPDLPDQYFILNRKDNTWHLEINRLEFENKSYLYRLYFDDMDNSGNKITTPSYAVDPYAYGVCINGRCGVLLDINSSKLMPDGFANDAYTKSKQNAIIYEMHLRDFTIALDSGVSHNLKGKYLGAVESECTYSNGNTSVSTGIDSLSELGITHLHLLPIFDFSSVDETNPDAIDNRNWGYDPQNYNVPEGSYSTNPHDPRARIIEVRKMVHSFHQKGLGVIMDVVYNHMTNTHNMDYIVPGYYFRSNQLGKFTNGSGCGNELATERRMVGKFVVDSITHWIKDYKIDGIRLDLMALIDLQTMKTIAQQAQQINPNILIYGEPWMGGDSPLENATHRGTQKNNGFSIFNDIFRDAIRGSNYPGNGFINGEQHNASIGYKIIEGLKGSITELVSKPFESINYIDAHDNYALWDHIEKSTNSNVLKYRDNLPKNPLDSNLVRQNLLALGIILTAQGIPFLHGGIEMLRTKNGDHNSYRSSDEINAFHWQDKLRFKIVFDYVRGLIELRKNHPAFHMNDPQMIEAHLTIHMAHHNEHSGVIISHFHHNANDDSWPDIVIIYNATAIDNYEVNGLLPEINSNIWHMVVNHEKSGIETIAQFKTGDLPPLKSHSMIVLHS